MAFIFEWNSTASTPSPRSTRLAPALLLDDALRSFAASGSAGLARPAAARRRGTGCAPLEQRRRRAAGSSSALPSRLASTHLADADRVPHLERSELPAEAPPHRAIDVVDRVRDVEAPRARCRRASEPSVVAQKRADLVAAEKQRLRSARATSSIARRGVERRQSRRLPGPVRQRRRIERQDLRLAAVFCRL